MSGKNFDTKIFLEPENMIRLYASGAFPMAEEATGEIKWYLPEIRAVIPVNNYNYPRTLKQALKKLNFEIKYDTDFQSVVRGCADREQTWISEELITAYLKLKKRGFVHTVETWQENRLVGGLYGISFRGAFFGESMFSRVPQASKAALINLLWHLQERDFVLLDVQYMTSHLRMFGATEISYNEYQQMLNKAYERNTEF